MKFDLKVILIGGIAYYAAMFIASMPFGALVHEGVLAAAYDATAAFWRPELNEDPPNIGALMPLWITTGLITSFIAVFVFDNVRAALGGSGIGTGLKFGFLMALLAISTSAAYSGVFNLPREVWMWWSLEGVTLNLVGGAVIGFIVGKLRPAAA